MANDKLMTNNNGIQKKFIMVTWPESHAHFIYKDNNRYIEISDFHMCQ